MSDEYLQGWNEYTAITRETAVYPGCNDDTHGGLTKRILYTTLGLSGEVGEVVDVVKKNWRNHATIVRSDITNNLIDELGDVFWYLARLMDEAHITIDEVIEHNVTKLKARKEAGTIKER